MPDILNEQMADQAVITSLLRHIANTKGDSMKDIILYKSLDGSIQRATDSENITREDILATIGDINIHLQVWHDALAQFDAINGSDQAAAPAPEAPIEATSAEPVQPADIAVVGVSELQPVEINVIPADTSVQAEAPAPEVIQDVTATPLQ